MTWFLSILNKKKGNNKINDKTINSFLSSYSIKLFEHNFKDGNVTCFNNSSLVCRIVFCIRNLNLWVALIKERSLREENFLWIWGWSNKNTFKYLFLTKSLFRKKHLKKHNHVKSKKNNCSWLIIFCLRQWWSYLFQYKSSSAIENLSGKKLSSISCRFVFCRFLYFTIKSFTH